ncbi:MAG: DUF2279 domain-containing protein [Oligoflexus sp.]
MALTFLLLWHPKSFASSPESLPADIELHEYSPYRDIRWELGLAFTGITFWGVNRWKWFQRSMHARNEYGFSKSSSTGGSDKTGHYVSSYFLAQFLSHRLREKSYDDFTAAFYGSTAALALMTWIEIGDATCRYGLSMEDQLANSLGVLTSYLRTAYPQIATKLDVRLEYWPGSATDQNTDLVADYSAMKHLLALKIGGFDVFKRSPMRFVELHLGYYSRGYRSFDDHAKERVLYTALGLDFSALLNPVLPKGWAKVFQYYQPPRSYLERRLVYFKDD